jgi:hypothetical protein
MISGSPPGTPLPDNFPSFKFQNNAVWVTARTKTWGVAIKSNVKNKNSGSWFVSMPG